MADEYGNIEVDLEIPDPGAAWPAVMQTVDAVYAYRTRSAVSIGYEFTLTLVEQPVLPAGYQFIGFVKGIESRTQYNAYIPSQKTTLTCLVLVDGVDMTEIVRNGMIPTEIPCTSNSGSSGDWMKFLEMTYTYRIAPTGFTLNAEAEAEAEETT